MLGSGHFLSTIENIAMNMAVTLLFESFMGLDVGMELLVHMVLYA